MVTDLSWVFPFLTQSPRHGLLSYVFIPSAVSKVSANSYIIYLKKGLLLSLGLHAYLFYATGYQRLAII